MTDLPYVTSLPELVERARSLAESASRVILGITGGPGAGKSTLGRLIAERVGAAAELVPLDGFHLSQSRLTQLGSITRKGAPDTFDAAGFVALIRRVRNPGEGMIYAPEFRRDIEEPVAGAIPIAPSVRLVVVEGNYLLIPEAPWAELRSLLDEVWYCERDEHARLAGLIVRHRAHGKSEEEARRWALGPDQRNAELIARTRIRADRIVNLDTSLEPEFTDERERPRPEVVT